MKENINSIQIEIINFNSVDNNFTFLSNLGSKYKFHNPNSFQNIDFNLISTDKFSFNSKYSLQSISNRGTRFGEESSIGFKIAKQVNQNWSIAFGGENIIHLDK